MPISITEYYDTQAVGSGASGGGGPVQNPIYFLQMNGQDLMLMDGSHFGQMEYA